MHAFKLQKQYITGPQQQLTGEEDSDLTGFTDEVGDDSWITLGGKTEASVMEEACLKWGTCLETSSVIDDTTRTGCATLG